MSECLAYKILDVHEYFMFYEYDHAIAIYVDTIDCNYINILCLLFNMWIVYT